jgi:hypothetical protein
MSQSNGGVAINSRLTLFPMQASGNQVAGFYAFDPASGFNDTTDASSHSYRVEEIIAGRTPTVSRLIVTYRDLGPVIATFSLSGTTDSQTVVSNSVSLNLGNPIPTGKLMTVVIGLTLTAQNLQLTVSRGAGAGALSLAKVVLCGRVEMVKYA